MTAPFRWSLAKREQLGSLIGQQPIPNHDEHHFLPDLRATAARIIALSDDAHLVFIGRTPENFYDYLSGVFNDVDDAPNLYLIPFSMRWAGNRGIEAIAQAKRDGLLDALTALGVDPHTIARSARPFALVDYVAEGGTMENFIKLLHRTTQETTKDWPAVARKLRIIGLRTQTHNSPNTWRWQQHQDWLDLIPNITIKNVSAPAGFLGHIANQQDKVTQAHYEDRWAQPINHAEQPTQSQRQALAYAAHLYDLGRLRDERRALAKLIAREPQMNQTATRALVLRLKGT